MHLYLKQKKYNCLFIIFSDRLEIIIKIICTPAGEESVSVTFTYDINSLLEVIIKSDSTTQVIKKIIRNTNSDISEEEAKKRFEELEYLKLPPREQEKNKLVLFQAEELYEELLGEARERLGYKISIFEAVLNRGEPEEIEEAREDMKKLIQMFQTSPF